MHSHRYGRNLVAMAPLALSASMAYAQAGTVELASTPIDELKEVYMTCDRAASRQVLDMETAAQCSFVGEALQARAFEGSFDKLLAWWRTEKDAPSSRQAEE